jgi:hypothetical protein
MDDVSQDGEPQAQRHRIADGLLIEYQMFQSNVVKLESSELMVYIVILHIRISLAAAISQVK